MYAAYRDIESNILAIFSSTVASLSNLLSVVGILWQDALKLNHRQI